jgi:hypothetical protein
MTGFFIGNLRFTIYVLEAANGVGPRCASVGPRESSHSSFAL